MADQVDLGDVWKATLEELVDEISSRQQRAYLQLTKLRAIVEDTALISVPDAFTRDVIESRLRPAITETLSSTARRPSTRPTDRSQSGRAPSRSQSARERSDPTNPPASP